jgi:hypothetical protein
MLDASSVNAPKTVVLGTTGVVTDGGSYCSILP